jgi:hypothetical protein
MEAVSSSEHWNLFTKLYEATEQKTAVFTLSLYGSRDLLTLAAFSVP